MFRFIMGMTVVCVCTPAFSADYKSAREARAEAAKQLRARNYVAAQEPLEAALKLTPESEEKERVDIYRALTMPYRQLPEPDKMIEAMEYIQEHSDSQPERANLARDFCSFMHQRGKTADAVARYEGRLKDNEKDPTALAVLSVIYTQLQREKRDRGEKLKTELQQLDRDRAIAKAVKLEAAADQPANAAASNWKDVAKTWIEAKNHERAQAAVERSLEVQPETRSTILTMFWHDGLGDVYVELGEKDAALKQFHLALDAASADALKKPIQTKIDKLKAAP